MNVAVIGAGYVGCVGAACLAKSGHRVWNVEVDPKRLASLRRGKSPFFEPGLDDLLRAGVDAGNLRFSDNLGEALDGAQCVLLAVGTPPEEDGSADLSYIFQAAREIIDSAAPRKDSPLVVVTKSTVPPGTGQRIMALIEKGGRNDILCASNPEFLREGQAIEDWFEGDRIVIGVNDERAEAIMRELYADLDMPLVVTDVTSAEMIKYTANAFLATKISFINEIANVCEAVGADILDVAKGAGMDRRVGTSFFSAGVGYGGSCFPKDVRALQWLAMYNEYDFQLLKAVIDVNNRQRMRVLYKLRKSLASVPNSRVAVLGLSFKPNTDDVRESPALEIIGNLVKLGAVVTAYDPMALEAARSSLPEGVWPCENVHSAVTDANAVVLVTEWDEFRELDWKRIRQLMAEDPVVVDGRNILDPARMRELGFVYEGFGRV